jgi:hypothetical protein
MADPPPYFGHGDDIDGSDRGTPRWVKVFGIIVIAVVLLLGIIKLTGGAGGHGPGRHTGQSQE